MVLCDVNVMLYACTPLSSHHQLCHGAVRRLSSAGEPFALSELVLAAVVRLATNPRLFQPPASTKSAFAFADAWRDHRHAVVVSPGARHWRIFKDLVLDAGLRGGDTTDAYLAALAIEHACEWWTTDSDFSRFAGLRWRNLLADRPH